MNKLNIELDFIPGEPVIEVLNLMADGYKFEVVDIPRCERKWYINRDGEYVNEG